MLRWILLLGGVVGAPSAAEPAVVFGIFLVLQKVEENPWSHGDPFLFLVC